MPEISQHTIFSNKTNHNIDNMFDSLESLNITTRKSHTPEYHNGNNT